MLCARSLQTRWQADSLGMESDIPDMICGNGSLSIEGPTVVRYRHLLVVDMGDLVPVGCSIRCIDLHIVHICGRVLQKS